MFRDILDLTSHGASIPVERLFAELTQKRIRRGLRAAARTIEMASGSRCDSDLVHNTRPRYGRLGARTGEALLIVTSSQPEQMHRVTEDLYTQVIYAEVLNRQENVLHS